MVSEVGSLNQDDSWFQRLAKVTFDVLTPLANLIAPDRGRAKSSLMNKTVLRERFLMSVPTYPNIGFTPTDGSTRVPEHFPVRIRPLKQWEIIVLKHEITRKILGIATKANDEMSTDSDEESSDSGEDLSDANMTVQEMVHEVPKEFLEEACKTEEEADDEQVFGLLEDVSRFVCPSYVHFINSRNQMRKTSLLMRSCPFTLTPRFSILPSQPNSPAK